MFRSEITISSPPKKVWDVFTQCENWAVWWGGNGLKSAEWTVGGKMYWGVGGCSTILELAPARRIHYQLKGAFTADTLYTFQSLGLGRSTRVMVQVEYTGVDVGASKQRELDEELTRLKRLVEKGSV